MKKYISIILALLFTLAMTACGNGAEDKETGGIADDEVELYIESDGTGSITVPESNSLEDAEEDEMKADRIYIKIGETAITAVLEKNESAEALKNLLTDGAITISASNYGGFEKVCSLGTSLPRNDVQTNTQAGDICLYNGNQIVIFYGSNSWEYTRLGKVSDKSSEELKEVLSGEETEITLSLEQ